MIARTPTVLIPISTRLSLTICPARFKASFRVMPSITIAGRIRNAASVQTVPIRPESRLRPPERPRPRIAFLSRATAVEAAARLMIFSHSRLTISHAFDMTPSPSARYPYTR